MLLRSQKICRSANWSAVRSGRWLKSLHRMYTRLNSQIMMEGHMQNWQSKRKNCWFYIMNQHLHKDEFGATCLQVLFRMKNGLGPITIRPYQRDCFVDGAKRTNRQSFHPTSLFKFQK